MNGAPRNAQRLPGLDVDRMAVDGPGQDAVDAVDRFFELVVAVRRGQQALRGRDRQLERGDAAGRVVAREQEPHRERSEMDGLVGGIGVDFDRFLGHIRLLVVNSLY